MKIKLLFAFMLFSFVFLLIFGIAVNSKTEFFSFFEKATITYYSVLEETRLIQAKKSNWSECELSLSKEKIVIIRIDDIRAGNHIGVSKELVEMILESGYKVSLGVIPEDLGNKELISWLRDIKDDSRVEIALHGYEHSFNEFKELSEEDAGERIKQGKEILMRVIGVNPATFIPPYNEYSIETVDALKEEGFMIISAKKGENDFSRDFAKIGYAGKTYDFYNNASVMAKETLDDCKKSLDENNFCVIMIHPQDYSVRGEDRIDEEMLKEFYSLIDGLNKLEAEPITFKDLLDCKSFNEPAQI